MKIECFSDGSATTKEKPGGYGWVLVVDNKFYSEGSGHLESATNNDAELIGAIKGLEAALNLIASSPSSFPIDFEVTLKSDSELILGWASGQYKFKQIDKLPFYDELRRFMRKLHAKTEWVKGHSGNQWNERCDKLANKARLGIQKEKEKEEAKITGNTLIGKKKEGILCVWHNNCLKIIDLDNLIVEVYDRQVHGKRGSMLEIREDKMR